MINTARARQEPTRRTIGLLVRNSTVSQVGNYRSEAQREDLEEAIAALGWDARPYDERGTSGSDLAKRPVATQMLSDLRAGAIHGIAVHDIKRASRDRYEIDFGQILKALVHSRGVIVTPKRVYDPRVKADSRLLRLEGLFAGMDWEDIRDTMWSGRMKRLRAEPERFEPIWFGTLPFGYALEVIDPTASRIRRRLVRSPGSEVVGAMERLIDALNREKSMANVARASGLRAHNIRRILENDLYWGQWTYGRKQDSDVWEGHGVVTRYCPDLAYWTHAEALAWRRKFAHRDHAQRKSRFGHPTLGVFRCSGCHQRMVGSGPRTLACPKHDKCPAPQFITETRAFAAVLDILRELFEANRERFEDRARRRAADAAANAGSDPVADLDAQLEGVDAKIDALLDVVDGRPTGRLAERLADLKDERRRLASQRDELLSTSVEDEDALEADVRATLAFGPAVVKARPFEAQARSARTLLGPRGWIELERHGERAGAKYTVSAWSVGD